MSNDKSNKPSVLVLLATGKLGSGIIDAFTATNKYQIYGTSRNEKHPALLSKGVTPIPFQYGDKNSIERALEISKPQVVISITKYDISNSVTKEVEQGKLILDACQRATPSPHVILTSTELADVAPEQAAHLKAQKELEEYIVTLKLDRYTILRSSSFFENFDDPTVYNPLARGYLKDLYEGWVQVNHVSTRDVGKAAVVMAGNPKEWQAKTLSCITSRDTGDELVQVLSEVSGVDCVYQAAPPRFILRFVLKHLYAMVELCRTTTNKADWSKEMREFRQVVPDAMDFKQWLLQRQKTWSDGTAFGASPPNPTKQGPSPAIVAAIGVAVVAVGAMAYRGS